MKKIKFKNSYLQDDIEWDDYDAIIKCDHCEQKRRCQFVPDPFIFEVYPEDSPEPSYWCIDCYSRRKDEV